MDSPDRRWKHGRALFLHSLVGDDVRGGGHGLDFRGGGVGGVGVGRRLGGFFHRIGCGFGRMGRCGSV